jgi:hypothetical protein
MKISELPNDLRRKKKMIGYKLLREDGTSLNGEYRYSVPPSGCDAD